MKMLFTSDGRRARILHVGKFYPPYRGGMETHLQDLCRSIAPFADVSVLVSNSARHTVLERDGDIPVERSGAWANIASAPICPDMVRAIRRAKADIVHLHCPNPMAVISYLASGHSGHAVITYQSDVIRQRILRFAYQPLFNRVATRAKAIICLSPNYIESSPVLNRFREKCHVIPHGICPEKFEHADESAAAEIRARYGDRIVLAIGRLVYYKGFEYLIRAVAATDATLLIVGTGPLRERLLQVARQCGTADRVHFLGKVEDVRPYYHTAQLFALPSVARSEAFGIVQVEAMACGTPVVNTRLDTGVPFVSLHGVSGLTVPLADAPALQRAILDILGNPNLRARFSLGARQRVRELFTLDGMAEKTFQLYEQILSERTAIETSVELIDATV
jgi:glycosyltransferase involved in cell wall biosynthesis